MNSSKCCFFFHPARRIFPRLRLSFMVLGILLAACAAPAQVKTGTVPEPGSVLPAKEEAPGWTPDGEMSQYGIDNLFDLVDGQADAFFAYNFQKVAVQKYKNGSGAGLMAEVWQLTTPADAYGLFTASRTGQAYTGMGSDASLDPGSRLIFWQDRYYVSVHSFNPGPDEDLLALAKVISSHLPVGGEQPAVISSLPAAGLVEGSSIFFHKEISIQNEVWLGGINVLSLDSESQGVIARYLLAGEPARLLLVQYPDETKAQAAVAAVKAAGLNNLLAAEAKGSLLAAVFGKAQVSAQAEELVNSVNWKQ